MSKRTRSDEINAVGDMLFRRPVAPPPPPVPAAPPGVAPGEGEGGRAPAAEGTGGAGGHAPGSRLRSHPAIVATTERRTRRDVFDIDPRRILERGPYVREWDEEGEEFDRLVRSVGERREVDTPIWVRSEGPTGQRTFILVAGKGRLKAALRNDLSLVPVRDLGELSDQEAIARQAEENLHRRNMTPGETAYALWLMSAHGDGISEIARRVQRDKGYVSYLVKVGEAMQALAPAERLALSRRGALQIRQCQAIAALPALDARVAELRRLAAAAAAVGGGAGEGDDPNEAYRRPDPGAPAEGDPGDAATPPVERAARRRAAVDAAPFHARPIRHGRAFRMRWVRDDLRRDPVALAEAFMAAVRTERAELLAALSVLEAEGGDPAAIRRARAALERVTG